MVDEIVIDGSVGEGGGQILRTSLALSMLTGTPFRMQRIRANRGKPGLMRQHLTGVQAAAEVSSAEVEGAELRSGEVAFRPGRVRGGDYRFAIGSAGSTTLVAQTVLPALWVADAPSTLRIEGGTHNQNAPPFEFLQHAFLPQVARMGAQVTAELVRPGFYPAGGGCVEFAIRPAPRLQPLELSERGAVVRRLAQAQVANLDMEIARRELKVVKRKLGWDGDELRPVPVREAAGPGNIITLRIESEHVTEVFTGFGVIHKRAELVAGEAVKEARDYLAHEVPVGPHLADQLLLPMAMAGGGAFRTSPPTRHTRTNMEIIERFLPVRFGLEVEGRTVRISVEAT